MEPYRVGKSGWGHSKGPVSAPYSSFRMPVNSFWLLIVFCPGDTQLYISFSPTEERNEVHAVSAIEDCISELKLNQELLK